MSTVNRIDVGQLRRDRTQMAQQLRRVHQDLDHFIRALSHDMNANFMLLESSFGHLKKSLASASPDELNEIVAHVDACVAQSRRFLNDLIHLAKTGSVEMEPERVELAAVVDDVLFEQDELLRRRGIQVDVRRPLPAVWYNRQRLKQIITNLVRNALNHGCDRECPRIEIRAEKDESVSDPGDVYPTVQLRVHDNGPGIDPQFAEDVFLPGKRLADSAEEGSGMGLAIVKKIAEYYGGSAWIDYGEEGGTTIAIMLPGGFAVPAPTPWIAHQAEDHKPSLAGAIAKPRRPHGAREVRRGAH
ncbi:MAG: HAMP domain-containing histidine kinase [Pirellulales bacterium]|nr:HAMP domain-containing histidine kinase [Pirellulales bacterium]